MGSPSNQFQITGTPDPNEEAFFTDLNQDALKNLRADQWPRTADGGNTPTLYQDWVRAIPSKVKEGWGNYVYTRKRPLGDGVIRFFWVKNKTEAEKAIPFRITPTMGNHYWPPVLLGIDVQKSRVPRSVDTGNRVYRGNNYSVIPIWIPSADTGTLFILREFTSPDQFNIPQHPTPLATPVNFPVPGQGIFNFPESLHPDITVDSFEDSTNYFDTNTLGIISDVGITTPWFFPATDPKTWVSYILYDRQTQDDETGIWHRTQMEVNPPNLPRRQRGLA